MITGVLMLAVAGVFEREKLAEMRAYYERREILVSDALHNGQTVRLEAIVIRPGDARRHPLAVIAHGLPTDPAQRRLFHSNYAILRDWLVGRGFVVLVPTRQGCGFSTGDWADGAGECNQIDYVAGADSVARQIAAVVAAERTDPLVDASRILIVGHSGGGWGAGSIGRQHIAGVRAVLDFSPGRGAALDGTVCGGAKRLVSAAVQIGRGNSLPQLWLYPTNDEFFAPELAHRLHNAFASVSPAPVRLVVLPAYGQHGHGDLVSSAPPSLWAPEADRLLAATGLFGDNPSVQPSK